jgi:Tripartite tricarboxylate transporter TctB family.
MKKGNYIAAALFAALAGYVIWECSGFPPSKGGVPGPGIFPIIIAIIMLMASISLIMTTLRMRPEEDKPLNLASVGNKRVYLTMIVMIAYLLILPEVGFVATSAILMFALVQWFGRYSFIKCALWSLGIPCIIYFVFSEVLLVPFRFGFLM